MKKTETIGFADLAAERRKIKAQFFHQINTLIDWRPISNIINKHYQKGESVCGRPSYAGLVLFKMSLLQTWYGLSDYEVEDRVNDSISFSRFVGISLDEPVPDHSVLSRFRTELTQKNVYEKLFRELNKQLIKHKIIVRQGAIVDASIVDSPFSPKGKTTYRIEEDRSETERDSSEIEKEDAFFKAVQREQPGADSEARWVKKGGKSRFGFKKHHVTDEQGLVLGVLTTPANVNETSNLEDVLQTADLPKGIAVQTDKGYASKKNRELLKKRGLKDRIMSKAAKGKPLTRWEVLRNKLISRTRYVVERTFGSIKRWFDATTARYKGTAKTHTQNLMEAMAYNLYRSPGIIVSNCEKI